MVEPDELLKIVARLKEQDSDDGSVEAKRCGRQLSKDIWETVSAFANTAGGLIICGFSEPEGFSVDPDFDFERVRDQFIAGIGDGGQAAVVAHAPRYELSRGIVDGKQVLVIEIRELDIREKPCYIVSRGVQGGSYKRVDDQDVRLSATEIYELQSVLMPSDADGEVVSEAGLDDLDSVLTDAVIANRNRQSPRVLRGAATREQQLSRLNITNKAGAVRLAGLLAVGIYPQQYFPKLVIDIAVHPGNEKSEPGVPRFLDRQVCDGPLSACIEDALAVIGRNLRKASFVSGAGRKDEWEVPEEVLREALANATIHREYAPMFVGESVSVDIYPDRIEVTNPGGLWGGKTVDNLDDGNSRCRNPKLMSLMGAVPLEHAEGYVAESQGSGVASMIREMESRSLGRPRFVAKPDSFKVIFARHGVEIARNKAWISAHVDRGTSREEETLLMVLREHGGQMGVSEIRAELKWDSDDIRIMCMRLVEDGVLVDAGRDSYRLAEEAPVLTSETEEKLLVDEAILYAVEPGQMVGAREIADRVDLPISKVRYRLAKLVAQGRLVPTAGAHSRNRKYRRP